MAAEQTESQSANELPRFDGQLMNLGGWLRSLRQQEHLLLGDLSFFAKTGAQILNNGKVAVASTQHALLLQHQLLTQCEFSIVKPPPLGDRFTELHRRVRLGQNGLTSGGAALPTTIDANRIPEEFADTYLIRPQTIAALDLKLYDALLSLMGRREYYKDKMQRARRDSGVHLIEALLNEQSLVDCSHSSNAAAIDAKLRLEELRFETLSSTHPSSFTERRDELTNLLLELPEAERWPPSAIWDFYNRLMASLGDRSLGFAVRSSLTHRQMSEYDHEGLADAIVRRLSELYVEEKKHRAHINQRGGRRASPAAAFLATSADILKIDKDPIKNARPSCAICGKTGHTEE